MVHIFGSVLNHIPASRLLHRKVSKHRHVLYVSSFKLPSVSLAIFNVPKYHHLESPKCDVIHLQSASQVLQDRPQ